MDVNKLLYALENDDNETLTTKEKKMYKLIW